jgi:glucose uptake protein
MAKNIRRTSMIIIHSYPLAVCMFIFNMICFGSWSNTQKLVAKKWRFELFYWDFIFGVVLTALIAGLTLGSLADGTKTFLTDMAHIDWASAGYAIFGGIIWNIGNLLLVAAIAVAGMAVGFPIGGGIAWMGGVLFNFFLEAQAGKISGNPAVLFTGVAIVLIAIYLSMVSYKRLARGQQKASAKGILLSVAAGLFIAFFYGLIVKSIDPSHLNGGTGTFTPYTGAFFFTIGALLITFIIQPFFMAHPVQGKPVKMYQYFKEGDLRTHFIGMFGGFIFSAGLVANLMSANAAGPAIAIALGNAAPVVAILWGVLVWKEFKGAPKGTNTILTFMFLLYLIGLTVITYSKVAA